MRGGILLGKSKLDQRTVITGGPHQVAQKAFVFDKNQPTAF